VWRVPRVQALLYLQTFRDTNLQKGPVACRSVECGGKKKDIIKYFEGCETMINIAFTLGMSRSLFQNVWDRQEKSMTHKQTSGLLILREVCYNYKSYLYRKEYDYNHRTNFQYKCCCLFWWWGLSALQPWRLIVLSPQWSSVFHLQRRCTHQAAWETSASEGRN
jgi:hypothetical protein